MASTYLTRTPSSAGNRRTYTFSGWFKRSNITNSNILFEARIDNDNRFDFRFGDNEKLLIYGEISNSNLVYLETSAVYRDPSAWYHVVVTVDTTQSTQSDRVKVYVNGEQITSFATSTNSLSLNQETPVNTTNVHSIGANTTGGGAYDGYAAHVHFTDGYAYAASTFGSTATNGQWVPNGTPSVTYGTNGYFLKFTNGSDLGEDSSGNNNDFTKNGSGDKVTDTPQNVFSTLNPNDNYWANSTFSEGNCKMVTAGSGYGYPRSTIGLSTGKWYFEAKASDLSGNLFVGIVSTAQTGTEQEVGYSANDYGYKFTSGAIRTAGSETSYGNSISTSDILGVGIDLDNNKLYFSKNGTWQNSADPVSGSNGFSITAPSSTVVGEYFPTGSDINSSNSSTVQFNFGNPSFSITSGNADDNGEGNFEYAPPTGYLAICTNNLSSELSPTIDDGSQYFNTTLVTSTGSDITINTGFKPDFLWTKSRSYDARHELHNTTSGNNKRLVSNLQSAEETFSDYMTFLSNGATFKTNVPHALAGGGAGRTGVAWSWSANGGTTSSNSDGTITSTVQANQTAGFSVVTWTGNNTSGATVGHGLGKQVDMVITKRVDGVSDWNTWHNALTGTEILALNKQNAATNDASTFPDATGMNSTVFKIGNGSWINGSSSSLIAFCFASIEGYSKINSYTGNGSNGNGAFIYTGFRPSFVMIKNTDEALTSWVMLDSARSSYNPAYNNLFADQNIVENNSDYMQGLLSNGFKLNSASSWINKAGQKYAYMAFAENPFVDSSGIPVTAR